jgi:hypothetical protein
MEIDGFRDGGRGTANRFQGSRVDVQVCGGNFPENLVALVQVSLAYS